MNRSCPKCNSIIEYKSYGGWVNAGRRNSCCRRCASEASGFLERYTRNSHGPDNPFFGKTHSDDSKKKMIATRDPAPYRTDDFKQKMRAVSSGTNNPMYGKTYFDVWVEKYGFEEAQRRQEKKRSANAAASRGLLNSMYGRSTPQGSGNGWSGWYKGWFFRSLKELSYVVNLEVIESTWCSAETKELEIHYKGFDGQDRTYRADFLVNDRVLVEVKPIRFHKTPTVLLKKEAAEEFCNTRGLEYRLEDPVVLNIEGITSNRSCSIYRPIRGTISREIRRWLRDW
jgi:hypothetical protein